MTSKSSCVVIPARFGSSRFPGKPLCSLLGKPMILWVCETAAQAVSIQNVFVATDSIDIANVVSGAGFTPLMSPTDLLTGTDRLAYVSKNLDYDIFVNVQGDEPTVSAFDITRAIQTKCKNPSSVVNSYTALTSDESVHSPNIPKIVKSHSDRLLYISRSPLPGSINPGNRSAYFKQVCIYAFNQDELTLFGLDSFKSPLESVEDIEILRFLENDYPVQLFQSSRPSYAVDVPSDVIRVEKVLASAQS